MKTIIISIMPLVMASPVFAEVCDKERSRWNPDSGRVNQLEELFFFFTTPIGLGSLGLIIAAFYFKKRWLSIICAILLSLMGVLKIVDWFWLSDDIARYAYQEGCRASPLVASVILVLFSLGLIQYSRTRVTLRLNTVNLGDDLDDVEMLEAIETICGIKIEDDEAEKLVTVGELFELVNQKLKSKQDFDPIWPLVCQIVREHSGSRDPIDRNTTFFPKFAKERDQTPSPPVAPKTP